MKVVNAPKVSAAVALVLAAAIVGGCDRRYLVGRNAGGGGGADGAVGGAPPDADAGTGSGGSPLGIGGAVPGSAGTSGVAGAGGRAGVAGAAGSSSAGAGGAAVPGQRLASVSFRAGRNFTAGAHPDAVAVGDLNGDGKRDLAIANYGGGDEDDGNVSVLMGNGDGSFAASVEYQASQHPLAIAVGDLNGDGKLDIAVSNEVNGVCVLVNQGDGTFAPPVIYDLQSSTAAALVLGDLNGDGKGDIAVVNPPAGTMTVLMNKGDGTLAAPVTYQAGLAPRALVLGDLNGDGKGDIAVANEQPDFTLFAGVLVFMNKGDGTFAAPVVYASDSTPAFLAIGDLNSDGKPDLAFADSFTRDLGVLINKGNGTFGAAATTSGGPDVVSAQLTIADLNGDGKPDVATTAGASVTVFMNQGDGTFQDSPPPAYGIGWEPESLAVGDFNGDNRLDVVVACGINFLGYATLLLNDGDGKFVAAVAHGSVDFSYSVAIGDLNGDGRGDVVSAHSDDGLGRFGALRVSLGTGGGDLAAPVVYPLADPRFVAIGDLNGDGRPDLASPNQYKQSVSVLMNQGAGAFGPPSNYVAPGNPAAIALGDLNADGKLDMVLANSGAWNISVFLNAGGGIFAAGVPYPIDAQCWSVAVGDLNGDGHLDVALASTEPDLRDPNVLGEAPHGDVIVVLNKGNGTFGPAVRHAAGSYSYAVAIADVNGDGRNDLAAANGYGASVSVLINIGAGAFARQVEYPTGISFASVSSDAGGGALAAGDLNNDGKVDLAVASDDANLSILINEGGGIFAPPINYAAGGNLLAAAIGDLNGDGKADVVVNGELKNVSILFNTSR
ncbi:MAG: VCBS repeat-containing protein [Pseudomonadota bacterium]